uniref:PiggyBac transposable element derived 5 n=1 Tax=Callithrix jacchus TaxID=9483 RepID=A0A5F4VS18_CALJA
MDIYIYMICIPKYIYTYVCVCTSLVKTWLVPRVCETPQTDTLCHTGSGELGFYKTTAPSAVLWSSVEMQAALHWGVRADHSRGVWEELRSHTERTRELAVLEQRRIQKLWEPALAGGCSSFWKVGREGGNIGSSGGPGQGPRDWKCSRSRRATGCGGCPNERSAHLWVSGPTRKMPPSASAVDFFQLFVPDNVLKNMVVQTNMYAKKFQERFGSDGAWVEVTLTEMKAFLGYMISTSISHCESVLSIWSGGFYSNHSLALVMSQARFEKILKYFHVVAFRSSQTTHGLYKVQPFLDSLQSSFDSAFRPSQTQVLHEPLIDEDPVFIATCTERELRKRKKRKFSLWVRQCSSTGFIIQIYVHLKEGGGPDGLDALKNKPQLHSMVARSLCRNAAGKNYIIFTGPSITSLTLFEEFEKQGIYCCGLLSARKSDCTGLPLSMLTNPATPPARGQYQIKMKGNMSLICWYNKGHFRFLTNAYSPVQQGVIIKRKSGEIPCPLAVEAFAAHLSYICRYDDKYSKYFISHKPNKTWQQVFWFAISIAINNAYILYKMSDAYHVKRFSHDIRGACEVTWTGDCPL